MEENYDIPLEETVSRKIVNLNAITPRVTKYQTRNKGTDDQTQLTMVKMDHSNIYKENDILEEGLVEHIYNLNRDERRHLAETGEQLEAIRKEVDVITKLQAAVKERHAGDIDDLFSTRRAMRYGSGGEDHKVNKYQQRIEAERDRFSAKNLFNVRRPKTALGFEAFPPKKFFTPPVVETEAAPDDVAEHRTEEFQDDKSVFMPELKPPRAKSAKGYLQPTSASMRGFRPVTADVGLRKEREPDDLLPPRAMTAVVRSRSRRELEILSRLNPKDDGTVVTLDSRRRNREIKKQSEREIVLQELRSHNFELQVKVRNFLRDLERFNKGRQNQPVMKTMEVHRYA